MILRFERLFGAIKHRIYSAPVIYQEQFHYGSRETILQSFNLQESVCVKGSIQHGWYPPETTLSRRVIYDEWGRESIDLVWSKRMENSLRAQGRGKVHAVGSPWAHLLRAFSKENEIDSGKSHFSTTKDFLYVPGHSYPGWSFQFNGIDAAFEVATQNRKTVLLSWLDFLNREVREKFESYGFEIECAGYRGSGGTEVPWADLGNRKNFLMNLLRILQTHETIIVDEISSAFWYSLSLGKEVIVLLPETQYQFWEAESNYRLKRGRFSTQDISESLSLPKIEYGSKIKNIQAWREIARQELGFDNLGIAEKFLTDRKYTFELST